MECRHCKKSLTHAFVDLGFAPPSNAYLEASDLSKYEKYYPLQTMVCDDCWLVQTVDYAQADELFTSEYAYFSSTSTSWLAHARKYALDISNQLKLDQNSLVIEVASNDGYLLKHFVEANIPCIGIEPTDSTALAAEKLGIPVLKNFFGETFAKKLAIDGSQADLIIGNNVYAHVPDINDFTRGLKAALKPKGVITLEFPHLMRLLQDFQFDTIYHEHFSYLSLYAVCRIFDAAGLKVWHVEELETHGGSLRVYGCHADDARMPSEAVGAILEVEEQNGLQALETYRNFQNQVEKIKNDFLKFLIEQKEAGKSIAAYGAAAKGNTLLNYAGIKADLLPFVCDAARSKQNKYMPGSHIPILSPSEIVKSEPDYIVIFPWNIASEIKSQLSAKVPNAKFVTAVPALKVH